MIAQMQGGLQCAMSGAAVVIKCREARPLEQVIEIGKDTVVGAEALEGGWKLSQNGGSTLDV